MAKGVTRRGTLAALAGGVVPFLQNWYKGDRGSTGPANNTYFDVAAFRTQPSSNGKATLVGFGEYYFETHAAPYRDDGLDFIGAADTPLSTGAWVRQGADKVRIFDGGNVQDAIMAASSPVALLDSTRAFPVASTLRTADGAVYAVQAADATDFHLETAGGVKLKVVGSITPDALGAPCDGIGDDAPFFERAFRLSNTLTLLPQTTYRLASLIGLPDVLEGQTISADGGLNLHCNGATIRCLSPLIGGVPEAIFTSATGKATPDTLQDAYTGKFHVHGGNWTSDNFWAESTGCVIFNGDRIYQLVIDGGNYTKVNTVVKSFRTKQSLAEYPEGYIQSLTITGGTQFTVLQKIVDARKITNLNIDSIHCNFCMTGFKIHGEGDGPAVIYGTVRGMLFQGGGCAFVLGPVLAFEFSGGYLESNQQADALAAKCDIWFKAGSFPSSAVAINATGFQPHPDQIADPNYVSVRVDYDPVIPTAPPLEMNGCWTTGGNLVSPGKAILNNCGGAGEASIRNALSPASAQSAKRTTFSGRQVFSVTGDVNGDGLRVAAIDVSHVLALLPFQQQRHCAGEISILMRHRTASGVTIGLTRAKIGFMLMAASEGVGSTEDINDVYGEFWLEYCRDVAAGQNINTLGSKTKTHFTDPALTFSRSGANFNLRLTGYAASSDIIYGPSEFVFSHITVQVDATNEGAVLTSPIGLA